MFPFVIVDFENIMKLESDFEFVSNANRMLEKTIKKTRHWLKENCIFAANVSEKSKDALAKAVIPI